MSIDDIVMAGSPAPSSSSSSEQGVNFLRKPFTPDALARTVRRILDS